MTGTINFVCLKIGMPPRSFGLGSLYPGLIQKLELCKNLRPARISTATHFASLLIICNLLHMRLTPRLRTSVKQLTTKARSIQKTYLPMESHLHAINVNNVYYYNRHYGIRV
jgi:hypothetical protein